MTPLPHPVKSVAASPPYLGWATPPASDAEERLYAIRPRQIWAFLRKQPASYWLLCLYVFFEYVRPQSIYPEIDVLPWTISTLLLTVVAFGLGRERMRLDDTLTKLLFVYFGVIVLSTVTAFSPAAAIEHYELFLTWIVVYLLISNCVVTESRLIVFTLAFLLYSTKMAQHALISWAQIGFAFRDWGTSGAPGWFRNSGEFGIQMCIYAPMAGFFYLGLRRHLGVVKGLIFAGMGVAGALSTIASSSRGAMLGVATVGLWFLLKSRHKVRGGLAVAALFAAMYFLVPAEQKARFDSAGEDGTSVKRLTYWKHGMEIAREHPVFGVGFGNWLPYYRTYYNANGQVSHNIFIQAVSELGFTGLGAFCLLIGYTLVVNRRSRKLVEGIPGGNGFVSAMSHGLDGALIGFLVSGSFVTVLYYPYFWYNLAFTTALNRVARDEAAKARGSHPSGMPAAGPPVRGPVRQQLQRPVSARPAWHVPASAALSQGER